MSQPPLSQLTILGAGSWGTALAIVLAPRFDTVRLWARRQEQAEKLQTERQNQLYLPGFRFPENVRVGADLAEALRGAAIVLLVTPSTHIRELAFQILPHSRPETIFVSATKGIEEGTFLRMSQVIGEVLSVRIAANVAVLSGPTFAREVAAGEPAAVVVASETPAVAAHVQRAFSGRSLRAYTSQDVTGVEIGGALKNVIAIGAGICEGLGLGSNTRAALVTRGLAEITRLAVALGGEARTLAGLAGLGDLVLTTTGDLSRNRTLGLRLGRGESLETIISSTRMVAEGVTTCRAARDLAEKCGVKLPITEEMYRILYEGKDLRHALLALMERPLTQE
ncbi:MAG: NAD(P)H-dependent glycerol-3-phosphate dehydrogenase [Bryobacteraceae bacterium]